MILTPEVLCRGSLAAYIAAVCPWYRFGTHLDIIIQALEMVERGEIKYLMIWTPPRHSKSVTATQLFPSWYLGRHPEQKILVGCHSQSLANEFGGYTRGFMTSDEHKKIFPGSILAEDTHAKHNFHTTKGGTYNAVGIGSAITGKGGDLCIVDDPVKDAEAAHSPVQREAIQQWYQSTWMTRKQPGAREVIINTRWHENDLAGWLLDPHFQEHIEDWQVLCMPAIAEKDEGWRNEGEALWPEVWPLEDLLKVKKKAGIWVWPALYQQRPSAIEGMLIKREWFQRYAWNPDMVANQQVHGMLVGPWHVTQVWDTAFEEDERNDFSVCETWLTCSSGRYLLNVWRQRVLAPELFKAAVELAIYWRPVRILVEKKASGHGLVQQIKKYTRLPVIGIVPKGPKDVRLQGVSGYIESGGVFLPYQASWLADYENEMCAFPTGSYDDQVDCTSGFLEYDTTLDYNLEKYEDLEQRMSQEVNIWDH